MKVKVYKNSIPEADRNLNGIPEVREVEIPVEAILSLVYKYGQNDIVRVPGVPSVSVDDVIDMGDEGKWRVAPFSFELETPELDEAVEAEVEDYFLER